MVDIEMEDMIWCLKSAVSDELSLYGEAQSGIVEEKEVM